MGHKRFFLGRWWVAENGPLSPFSNIPWTSIVTLALWILMGFVGRESPLPATISEIAMAWIIALLAYAFYLYKIVENVYVVLDPEKWWVYPYLPHARRREILKTADLLDLLDLLFVSAYAANGLFMHAVFETDPATILALASTSSAFVRLLRISPMIAFAGFGTGFTDITPTGPIAVNAAYALVSVQVFTTVVVGSNIAGIIASRRTNLDD